MSNQDLVDVTPQTQKFRIEISTHVREKEDESICPEEFKDLCLKCNYSIKLSEGNFQDIERNDFIIYVKSKDIITEKQQLIGILSGSFKEDKTLNKKDVEINLALLSKEIPEELAGQSTPEEIKYVLEDTLTFILDNTTKKPEINWE